ncbi:TPA: hypothetical protein DCZ39_07525 [Patescibacteria group bacterium]|nr:hypothetical protein [Candidatus Gracilibacteria bacterium]
MDSFIDSTNYATAFDTLEKMLKNNPKYTELPEVKRLIDSTTSPEEKMFVVDKFKTIFSYVTEITDGKND